MKKFFFLLLMGFVFSLFAQTIEVEIVPDTEKEMEQVENEYQEMQFNDFFSNVGKGSYFGYLLNTDFEDILKDACKWKGCKKPLFISKQNQLVEEFKEWLSENYYEWIKENECKN